MTYPIIRLSIVELVVVALLVFVLPNLVQNFAAQGVQLRWATALLMGISNFLTSIIFLL